MNISVKVWIAACMLEITEMLLSRDFRVRLQVTARNVRF